jgi:hypothetical protein
MKKTILIGLCLILIIGLILVFTYSERKFYGISKTSTEVPSDYNDIFSDSVQPLIYFGTTYNNPLDFPISTFFCGTNFKLSGFIFRFDLDTASSLTNILHLRNEETLSLANQTNYQSIIEDFELKYVPNFPAVKNINLVTR